MPPAQGEGTEALQRLITQSKTEKFGKLVGIFIQSYPQCHAIHFKFPLEVDRQAFVRILAIFARQPDFFAQGPSRFGPIPRYELIDETLMGFTRVDKYEGLEPIRLNFFVDQGTGSIMGVVENGTRAALDQVVEENGKWYYTGAFLFAVKREETMIDHIVDGLVLNFSNMQEGCQLLK